MNNDLISKSELLEKLVLKPSLGGFIHSKNIDDAVNECSVIDAEPVRHGRWIEVVTYDQDGDCLEVEYKCSECGRLELLDDEPYCNCGAKMDGKECVPRKCGTCSNDGWDMPQWRGTQEEV